MKIYNVSILHVNLIKLYREICLHFIAVLKWKIFYRALGD